MRKKIYVLVLFLYSLLSCGLFAQSGGSYSLDVRAGELATKLPADRNEVRDLTLKGSLNTSDLGVLRTLLQMRNLNMQDVSIEEGGSGYTSPYFPGQTLQVEKPNTLPKGLFSDMKMLQSVILPTQLVAIGDGAFRASGLTYIEIPTSTTEIGERAFAQCASLTKVQLHKMLPKFSKGIFEDCTALVSVLGSKVQEVDDAAFRGCKSLKFNLSGGVIRVGDNAFRGCASVEIAYLAKTVTYLGHHAFDGCSSLSMIFMKSSIANMGEYVFANCPQLININIPYGQTVLPKGTFSECSALKEVWLGNGLDKIETLAFENCFSLSTIRIDNHTVPTVDGSVWKGVNCGNVELKVPSGTGSLYQAHAEWQKFKVNELPLGDEGEKVVTIYQKYGTGKSLKVGFRSTLPVTFDLSDGKLIKKAPGTYSSARNQVVCTNGGKMVDILSMPTSLLSFIINDLDGNDVEHIAFRAPELNYLWISGSQITSLDLSKMPKIEHLNLYDNVLLESIDLSHTPNLRYLDVSFDEKLQTLNLASTPKLTTLKAAYTNLSSWNLSLVPLLKELDLSMTAIKELDLRSLTEMEVLMLFQCSLEHVLFPEAANLKEVFINDNLLSAEELNAIYRALPVRDASDEAKIYVKNNPGAEASNTKLLKSKNWTVDVEGTDAPDLTQEAISLFTANKTISLNLISGVDEILMVDWGDETSLEEVAVSAGMQQNMKHTFETDVPQHEVKIYGNEITALSCSLFNTLGLTYLDVSHCPSLQKLIIPNRNDLLSLDLSKNNSLTHIDLAGCKLNTLTLPENGANIQELKLSTNDIARLDLTGLTSLEVLSAPSNKLRELDLTHCRKLKRINLNLNGLEKVVGLKDLPELIELDIANNTLPFSMLPPKGKMTSYVYSQYWYDIPEDLIEDYTIDLSQEYMVQGVTDTPKPTTFTWYIQKTMDERIEVPKEAYTENQGVFTFNDKLFPKGEQKVEIFVLMNNPSFPDINTKTQGLRSGFVTMNRILQEEPLDPTKFDTRFEGLYENAFAGAVNLVEIKLPKNTKEIRHKAFNHCPKLKAAVVTAPVESLFAEAFDDQDDLVIYVPSEEIKEEFEKAFQFQKTKIVVGDGPTALDSIVASRAYTVAIEGHILVLTSCITENREVQIFNAQGQTVAQGTLPALHSMRLAIPQSGCYILVVENEVSKVLIP